MYTATTRAIRVTVEPVYLEGESDPATKNWTFAYHVVIVNEGSERVRLMSRHWRITDSLGRLSEVRGEGVIGQQPILQPGESFAYTSGTQMPTPSGIMSGTYQMIGADGLWFDVDIPAFSLDAPDTWRSLN